MNMKQKYDKVKKLTVNIHSLGMVLQELNNWYWETDFENDFEYDLQFRSFHTRLLLLTDDKELDDPKIFKFDKEKLRNLLVSKHYEYLHKWRNELLQL